MSIFARRAVGKAGEMNITYLALELKLTYNVVLAIFDNLPPNVRGRWLWHQKLKPLLRSFGFTLAYAERRNPSEFVYRYGHKFEEKEVILECTNSMWAILFNPRSACANNEWRFLDEAYTSDIEWRVFKFYRNSLGGDEFFAKIEEIFQFNFPNVSL